MSGTNGIVHTIHVGYGGESDEQFEHIDSFENVVDAVNLPSGDVRFSCEDGSKVLSGARIIRSRVAGLDDASRYRCRSCQAPDSDLIGKERGDTAQMMCHVCGEEQEFERRPVNEV